MWRTIFAVCLLAAVVLAAGGDRQRRARALEGNQEGNRLRSANIWDDLSAGIKNVGNAVGSAAGRSVDLVKDAADLAAKGLRMSGKYAMKLASEYAKVPLPLVLFLLDVEANRYADQNQGCSPCKALKTKAAQLLNDAALTSAISFAGDLAKTAIVTSSGGAFAALEAAELVYNEIKNVDAIKEIRPTSKLCDDVCAIETQADAVSDAESEPLLALKLAVQAAKKGLC